MLKKILISTDGSPLAEEAAPMAVELARSQEGEIRIVSVIEPGLAYGTQKPEEGFFDSDYYRRLRSDLESAAQAAADRIAGVASSASVTSSVSLRTGHAATELLAEAADWGADVIVMSTHGRRGVLGALLGSCATEVVHSATCPVLLHRKNRK